MRAATAIAVFLGLCAGCSPVEQSSQKTAAPLTVGGGVRFATFVARPLPFALKSWSAPEGAGAVNAVIELGSFELATGSPSPYGQSAAGSRSLVYIHVNTKESDELLVGSKRAAGQFEGLQRFDWEEYASPLAQLVLPAPFDGHIRCPARDLTRPDGQCSMYLREGGLSHTFNMRAATIKDWRGLADGYLKMARPLFARAEAL